MKGFKGIAICKVWGFGGISFGIWYGAIKNRYLYNGIEHCDDFDLNWDMAVFRSYDAAIGRWTQVDPKYTYSQSVYTGMGNNPILYSDMMGDTVRFNDPNAEAVFNTTYQNIVDKIDEIDNSDMKQRKKNRNKKSLLKDKKVLDNLKDSEEIFVIETVERENAGFALGADGNFRIGIPEGEGTEDLLFHEGVHGNQYLEGKIDFGDNGVPLYYDYSDELDAYSQQFNYARKYLGKDLKKIAIGKAKVDASSITDKSIIQGIIKQRYEGNPHIIKSFTPVNKPQED